MKPILVFILPVTVLPFNFCTDHAQSNATITKPVISAVEPGVPVHKKSRTIHVFVALCDNKYQGIVPVGKSIGNGQDPESNLYWGCDLGLRTYFKKKNSDW